MRRAAPFAVLGLLIAPAVALAAPPWSPPENVSSPSLFVDSPQVEFDGGGRGYALWRRTAGTGPTARTRLRIAVRVPGAASFGPERNAPNFVTPLLSYGTERVLALDERSRGRTRVSLRARFSRPDGSFGRPDTISTHRSAGPPSIASHDQPVAAWIQHASRGRRIVRVAIRRGSRFGRPFTLRARGRARRVVAGAGQGVQFVAWERAGVVEARVRFVGRPSGWTPVQRIGPTERGATLFGATFNGRRGYLAWRAQEGDSAVVRAAVLPIGHTRFRPPQVVDTIERSEGGEHSGLRIVPVPEREALLAWTDSEAGVWRVRAAVTGPGPRFGAPVDVSPPGEQAVLGDAAAGTSLTPAVAPGAVMVVWSRLDAVAEVGDRVRASLRPPGGSFGPPEDVSDGDRARLPDVGFDHIGNRWTAVWSQRSGPDQGVPLNQITTFLRSSTRPG